MIAPTFAFFARMPRWAWALIVLAVVVGLLWWMRADAYSDGKRVGTQETDAKWQKAHDKLIQQSLESGKKADKAAAVRQADFAAKVEDEKERIDQATAEGGSPLDVLFGERP